MNAVNAAENHEIVPSVAVYIHIPWCASLCPYCDFDKQATDFRLTDQYLDAIERHLNLTSRRRAHSLYFGGGTPSLLTPSRLARVIDACRGALDFLPNAEVTVEANPSDVVAHKIEAYLRAGVNRISLGVQSLNDADLRFLGRRHTADKAARAVAAIREAGCDDLSVDLMYGLPSMTVDSLRRTLDALVALGAEHVSCYALTVESSTPMGADVAAGILALPESDDVADQYGLLQSTLASAGYRQYELSNWARPGHESVHNLTYWRNGEYLGLGAGAAGSFEGARYKRNPVVREYIAAAEAGEPGFVEWEPWTPEQQMRDTVMLALRLEEGISETGFERRFGLALESYCTDRIGDLIADGVLHRADDQLKLDPEYYFVCNAVLGEILPQPNPSS